MNVELEINVGYQLMLNDFLDVRILMSILCVQESCSKDWSRKLVDNSKGLFFSLSYSIYRCNDS